MLFETVPDDVYEEVQTREPRVPQPSRKPKPQVLVVDRTDQDWEALFPRYPTCADGFVKSFEVTDPEWLAALDKFGVVVIKVLSEDECNATLEEMFADFNGDAKLQFNGPIKQNDPITWDSRNWPSKGKFLLSKCCFGQNAMNNRTHPIVYEAFKQIYKTDALWSSLDKWGVMRGTVDIPQVVDGEIVKMEMPNWRWNLKPHWDYNPHVYLRGIEQGLPEMYQGIIAIDSCPEEVGGFHTVPGSRKFLDQWCLEHLRPHNKQLLVRADDSDPILKYLQKFPLRKGEMVIWSSGNVHCNFANRSSKMRLTQFVRMMPSTRGCQNRDRFCCRRILRAFPGEIEQRRVELSDTQKKLMGLLPWNDEVAELMAAYDREGDGTEEEEEDNQMETKV